MAITKEKKKEIIAKVKNAVDSSGSVVFVNFHGLCVSDTTKLRKNLRDEGVGYTVAKKTLIKKVLGESKIEGDTPILDGELAIAYSKDLIAPARGVYDFKKEHKDGIALLGGIFEGRYMNKEEITEIASIPPTPVLYGQFVNLINSPIQGFVAALGAIADKKEA
jgi:large subunit ribosomal protein L10